MKPLFLAAAVAAFFVTGCAETRKVCRTYGNQTICRTEREPSADWASSYLDYTNCIQAGKTRGYCKKVHNQP